MIACSNCGAEHNRPKQRYCRACHAEYMREWRKTNPLTGEALKRQTARAYAREYKARGHIEPVPCAVCGAAESQMHHPDHELPKVVVWLCRPCHLAWHAHWRATVAEAWSAWLHGQRCGMSHGKHNFGAVTMVRPEPGDVAATEAA